MKEQKITVEIDEHGGITADAEGFSGEACLRDLENLLNGLGALERVERKPDAGDKPLSRRSQRTLTTGKKP